MKPLALTLKHASASVLMGKKCLSICVLVAIFGCRTDIKQKVSPPGLLPLEYTYYESGKYIPRFIMDTLCRLEGSDFRIADRDNKLRVNLSDAWLDTLATNKRLRFALVGDSTCIIVYQEGGYGDHDVLYLFHYKDKLSYRKYLSSREIVDTAILKNLRKQDTIRDSWQ
jgi:hypothetical protein